MKILTTNYIYLMADPKTWKMESYKVAGHNVTARYICPDIYQNDLAISINILRNDTYWFRHLSDQAGITQSAQ